MIGQQTGQRTTILWAKALGLAGVQGAVSLLWVTYNLYLPKLLGQVGLPAWAAVVFLVLEGLLAVVLEPLSGQVSDQLKFKMSTRYPFVVAAGISAVVLFVGLPVIAHSRSAGIAILGEAASPLLGWLFGAVIMAWAITMSLFRSPILALLGKCAPTQDLPKAASVLMIFSTLIGAAGTLWGAALKQWDPINLFILSSLALLVAGLLLQQVYPQSQWAIKSRQPDSALPTELPMRGFALLVVTGFILTFAIAQFKGVVNPKIISLPGFLTFLTLHLLSLFPSAYLAKAVGNSRLMGFAGVAIAVALTGLLRLSPESVSLPICALLGMAFSPIVNGMFPWILSRVPESHAGLGVGLFFSGAGLAGGASALLGLAMPSLELRMGLAAGAFLLTSLVVLGSRAVESASS